MKNTIPNPAPTPAPKARPNRPDVKLATKFHKITEMFDVNGNRIGTWKVVET